MKSRYVWSLLILGMAFLGDQVSKSYAVNFGTLHFNRGFIMGYFAEGPEAIRIVALGFFAALLCTVYSLLLYVLPKRARIFKYSLSLLMGGALGNVFDKLSLGATRDFIPFTWGSFHSVFNLADVFIWIGAMLLLWIVLRKDYLLWYHECTRRSFLINPGEQIRFAAQMTLIGFNSCLMLGVFSYAFVASSFSRSGPLVAYSLALFSISLFICLLTFVAGIIMSHRRLGALYAFELFVNDLLSGKNRPLRLREGDHYKHLELTSEKLRSHFHRENDK